MDLLRSTSCANTQERPEVRGDYSSAHTTLTVQMLCKYIHTFAKAKYSNVAKTLKSKHPREARGERRPPLTLQFSLHFDICTLLCGANVVQIHFQMQDIPT